MIKSLAVAVLAGLLVVAVFLGLGILAASQFHDHDLQALVSMGIGAVGGWAGVMVGMTVYQELHGY